MATKERQKLVALIGKAAPAVHGLLSKKAFPSDPNVLPRLRDAAWKLENKQHGTCWDALDRLAGFSPSFKFYYETSPTDLSPLQWLFNLIAPDWDEEDVPDSPWKAGSLTSARDGARPLILILVGLNGCFKSPGDFSRGWVSGDFTRRLVDFANSRPTGIDAMDEEAELLAAVMHWYVGQGAASFPVYLGSTWKRLKASIASDSDSPRSRAGSRRKEPRNERAWSLYERHW